MSDFKSRKTFDQRKAEAEHILQKYTDRIPVIVQKTKFKNDIPTMDKTKFLIPYDLTVGQFIHVIRNRMQLPPEKAIFLFVNDTIPPTSRPISLVYATEKDDDGFLYFIYTGEGTFGCTLQKTYACHKTQLQHNPNSLKTQVVRAENTKVRPARSNTATTPGPHKLCLAYTNAFFKN